MGRALGRCWFCAALVVVSAGSALAQPSMPSPPPPPPAPEPPSTVDPGVLADANAGRTWLSPTALTPPAGSWFFQDHELLFIGGGYAPTDNFVFSVNTMIPLTEDFPLILFGTAKLQLVRAGRVRAAAHASVLHIGVDDSGDDFDLTVASVGGVLTYCIDPGCHSLLNGYLAAGFALEDVDQSSVPFIANVGWVQRLGRRVKLVLEADTGFVVGEIDETSHGFLGWYGLRFTSANIGVDVGFAKPFCDDCDDSGLPLGAPWLSFTYRDM